MSSSFSETNSNLVLSILPANGPCFTSMISESSNISKPWPPEDKRINVFKKGISHALNVSIPCGGHKDPNSGVGFKLE